MHHAPSPAQRQRQQRQRRRQQAQVYEFLGVERVPQQARNLKGWKQVAQRQAPGRDRPLRCHREVQPAGPRGDGGGLHRRQQSHGGQGDPAERRRQQPCRQGQRRACARVAPGPRQAKQTEHHPGVDEEQRDLRMPGNGQHAGDHGQQRGIAPPSTGNQLNGGNPRRQREEDVGIVQEARSREEERSVGEQKCRQKRGQPRQAP